MMMTYIVECGGLPSVCVPRDRRDSKILMYAHKKEVEGMIIMDRTISSASLGRTMLV